MAFPHSLRALNHRDYRRFYFSQFAAQIGSWMQNVAQAWLVLQLTNSPFKLGLLATLQFSPVLLFSIVSGAVADRLPKRPLLVATQTTLALQGVIVTLLRMQARGLPPDTPRASIVEEIMEGVRYAANTPRLRLAIGLVLVVSLCVFNFSVYVPLLAKNVLGLGAEGFGFLMASLGVGAVAGALTVGARASRYPSLSSRFTSAILALGLLLGLGLTRRIEFAVPLLFFTGYWGIMLMASCNTSIQLQAPDVLRGRVMSLYTWVSGGVFPIGAFTVGTISQWWGWPVASRWKVVLGLAAVGG